MSVSDPNSDSFILGLRINPLRYASVAHRTDAVVAQALGVAFEALALECGGKRVTGAGRLRRLVELTNDVQHPRLFL
jgi:hypothetical protein